MPRREKDPYVRATQKLFDALAFDRRYVDLSFADGKIRHIREHIGKAEAKLIDLKRDQAVTRKGQRDFLRREVVPDLLIYRTQLANTLRTDLVRRVGGLMVESCSLAEAIESVGLAGGTIDRRMEVLEHGHRSNQELRDQICDVTVPELHIAAVGLAMRFKLGDPTELHEARLRYLLDQPGMLS